MNTISIWEKLDKIYKSMGRTGGNYGQVSEKFCIQVFNQPIFELPLLVKTGLVKIIVTGHENIYISQ